MGKPPYSALNVVKMMSATGGLFPALVGVVQAIFGEPDIDLGPSSVQVLARNHKWR